MATAEWFQSNSERVTQTWKTLADMYGPRFLRDYGDTAPAVWASAIRSMPNRELERGFRRLAAAGSGSTPTLPVFVKACRMSGDDEGQVRPASTALPPPQYDSIHGFGQRCLMVFLRTHGGTSQASLARMVEVKNKLVCAYRDTPPEERDEPSDLRDLLLAAFERLHEPMPQSETEIHLECFRRTGHTADFASFD